MPKKRAASPEPSGTSLTGGSEDVTLSAALSRNSAEPAASPGVAGSVITSATESQRLAGSSFTSMAWRSRPGAAVAGPAAAGCAAALCETAEPGSAQGAASTRPSVARRPGRLNDRLRRAAGAGGFSPSAFCLTVGGLRRRWAVSFSGLPARSTS